MQSSETTTRVEFVHGCHATLVTWRWVCVRRPHLGIGIACSHLAFYIFKKITDLFLFIDLDALGKPPSGILAGNGLLWLGSYSECTKKIDGAHYCLAEVDLGLASILFENSHIDGGDVNVNVSWAKLLSFRHSLTLVRFKITATEKVTIQATSAFRPSYLMSSSEVIYSCYMTPYILSLISVSGS